METKYITSMMLVYDDDYDDGYDDDDDDGYDDDDDGGGDCNERCLWRQCWWRYSDNDSVKVMKPSVSLYISSAHLWLHTSPFSC